MALDVANQATAWSSLSSKADAKPRHQCLIQPFCSFQRRLPHPNPPPLQRLGKCPCLLFSWRPRRGVFVLVERYHQFHRLQPVDAWQGTLPCCYPHDKRNESPGLPRRVHVTRAPSCPVRIRLSASPGGLAAFSVLPRMARGAKAKPFGRLRQP